MPATPSTDAAGFVPRRWALPHRGTNGYISTWGEMQAGVCPNPVTV